MGRYDFTLYDLIKRNAVCYAGKPAWFEAETGTTVSFGQFRRQVDRLAAGLQRAGVRAGDRVGVVGKNSLAFFQVIGAAAALGAIVLPVNWRLSAGEVAFNLNDGTPVMVFADEEFAPVVTSVRDQLSSVRHFVNLAGSGPLDPFDGLIGDDLFSGAPVDADAGLVIIHTAAVAGRPRGALLSHANLLCASLHFNTCFGLTPGDVHLNLLPLFHVAGFFMAVAAFHAGVLNVNMKRFDAAEAVQLIQFHHASVFFDFSPILGAILDEQAKTGADISSLRAVMGLDAADTIERYQQVTGGTFYNMYGQTETSCLATLGRYNDRPGAAGRPILMGMLELVDDADQPVAVGQVGEITLTGPMVFKGYWNLDDDNTQTFRNGRHHTGDLGRFDEDGFLWYSGRKPEKELIKPGGENVYPAEVEAVILAHPAVKQTVVIGVPDPKWKEGIKAVCVLEPGQTLTAEALIEFVGQRIARYKKPQVVEFVASLPEKDGSIDREAVKSQYGG
ncbi:acyl-CoA synthetase [Desulfosarcina ovata subsp. sediminis]|uniref:Acyl-CoA synthetase n=1 Tax=Desulfosarcina ovata subsp. sediminis TaxID=885957 RepID=A0A5K7ZVP6_9BACT|nr:AMP-binding protein [Desulfosarcina ovata]BBO84270.1 acyl-CoA synthetase [Desulfosarcina ovata subsp. sediminis]